MKKQKRAWCVMVEEPIMVCTPRSRRRVRPGTDTQECWNGEEEAKVCKYRVLSVSKPKRRAK